jgi:hypothetical protein
MSAKRRTTALAVGGPSIESNAMVGPPVEPVVSDALEVLVVVQPDASAAMSAANAPYITLRACARFGSRSTTDTPLRRGGSMSAFASPNWVTPNVASVQRTISPVQSH